MILNSRNYKILLTLLTCMISGVTYAAEDDLLLEVFGRPISHLDVDTSKPVEYSRHSDDVFISLTYYNVQLKVYGDGAVRGERVVRTSYSGMYGVEMTHSFKGELSDSAMKHLAVSTAYLSRFELSEVKEKLESDANCWSYCTDIIMGHGLGVTAELDINFLKYELNNGEIVVNRTMNIKWDETDIFEAAVKFPHIHDVQSFKSVMGDLLQLCSCSLGHHARF